MLIRGSFGGVEVEPREVMETGVDGSTHLFDGPACNVVYDGDRLKVRLELEIYQHDQC